MGGRGGGGRGGSLVLRCAPGAWHGVVRDFLCSAVVVYEKYICEVLKRYGHGGEKVLLIAWSTRVRVNLVTALLCTAFLMLQHTWCAWCGSPCMSRVPR